MSMTGRQLDKPPEFTLILHLILFMLTIKRYVLGAFKKLNPKSQTQILK